jgi:hypothetical protein
MRNRILGSPVDAAFKLGLFKCGEEWLDLAHGTTSVGSRLDAWGSGAKPRSLLRCRERLRLSHSLSISPLAT